MAAQAEIGALRVRLAMDAGEFRRGAKAAESTLDRLALKFGAAAGAGAAAGQLLANSVAGAASGIARGFTGAIASIGELVDASSKFGIPVEQLAGLKHAAELSGASFEQLGVGAGKLAKNLAEIAGGKTDSPAAKALAALGVSATDSAGQLKNVDAVMIELAGKFAATQDGSAKTAIAMQLFGKSGAQLIPMLNSGSAELSRMRDEARRLGLVLDDETANGLEALGDEWDKVGKRMDGFYTQLAGQLLPALKLLVRDIHEWLDSGGGVQAWAKTVGDGIKSVIDFTYQAGAAFDRLRVNLGAAGDGFANFFSGRWSDIAERNRVAAEEVLKIDQQLAENIKAIWAQHNAEAPGPANRNQPDEGKGEMPIPDAGAAERARAEAQKLHNAELERYHELLRVKAQIESEVDPIATKLAETQNRLGAALQKSAIDAETYGIAMQQATAVAANAYGAVAQSIVSDLGKVFENNKAVAIATALVNTFQGVTNALASVPYPLNLAAAATSLAAGMAQVANIRKTTKSSGGGGGGGSSSSSSAASTAPAQPQQLVTINLQGQNFGRDQVMGLIGQINAAVADGAQLRVA
jgi:hypothetical protein